MPLYWRLVCAATERSLLPFQLPVGINRWVQRWYPSSTLQHDPLVGTSVDGRYMPVPIAGWKLTPRMVAVLLSLRKPKPLTFSTSQRLAVIVPIRDRETHLAVLVPRLISKLNEQGINYRIVAAEQEYGKPFNRGALINAGLQYAADSCDYYCLHDVDAIPVEANYLCPSQPLRLVTRLIGSKSGLMRSPRYFSGVITLVREQALNANGFSNQYWGWGKEDDDFLFRLLFAGLICYYDSEGVFEDLHNPAHQQINLSNLIKPTALRRNRRRRASLVRGLSDPASDGVNVAASKFLKHSNNGDYERLLVRV
jgi:N-terminal region of glycosyl transferase group 7/N-terminal domain of galactosyltransferase